MPNSHPNRVSTGYRNYNIISGILTLFSTICVTLRFIQRRRTGNLWWDDWTTLSAFILAFGVFITNILISIPSIGAAGYHIDTYSLEQLSTWAKIGLAAEVLYNLSVSQSKISVLLFFRRIFSIDTHFLIFMRVMLFFILGITTSSVFGLIFSDNPVQAQWDFSIPHTTINTKPFYIISAIVNILLDAAILGFAQLKVWKLQLDRSRKLLLSLVFLIGGLTIISSILRIIYLETINLDDPTYTLTTPGIWTNVEMFLSIICACLPVIYSLFRSLLLREKATSHNQSTGANKSKGPLLTIGGTSTKFNRTNHSEEDGFPPGTSGYEVLCEPIQDGETHSMAPLDPVRVRTEYSVSH
ncbi:hypothetical protein F4679DRAFT_532668 [Xylaria curta]|nr:hypothetical protein F4679DRAFT_532668 [Xylaria curta]